MNQEYKHQRIVCIVLSLVLCFSPIVSSLNVINVFLRRISLNTGLIYIVYFALMALFIIFNIRTIPKRLFAALIFFFVSYIVTKTFFPQNSEYMWTTTEDFLGNPTYIWVFYAMFGYIVGFYLKDIKQFVVIFEKFSIASIALLAIRFFMGFVIKSTVPEYMTFSYNLLLPTTFMLLLCIKEFRLYRAVLSILGTVLILVAGCRGALIGLVVSPLIYVFFFGKLENNRKYRISAVLLILTIVVLFFYEPILRAVSSKLTSIGLKSRTIEMLLDSTITDDSSRGTILDNAISNLNFFGHGLWGDRVILNGKYPHNIIVEILIDYGFILGTVILIYLLYILFRGLRSADALMSVVLCSLLSSGLIKLLLSGSFVNQEPAFYVLISLCVVSYSDSYIRECNIAD